MKQKNSLLIIYTSKNGRTERMVEPIHQGIRDSGLEATVRLVGDVRWEEMLSAEGIIIGTPVRFGGIDWEIKRLFDVMAHQDYPGPLSGKVGGAFTAGGSPGSGAELALLSMLHVLLNHGMIIQGNAHSSHYGPIALAESSKDSIVSKCYEWGQHWGRLVRKLHE